jgi:hypothetical protein
MTMGPVDGLLYYVKIMAAAVLDDDRRNLSAFQYRLDSRVFEHAPDKLDAGAMAALRSASREDVI